MVTLKDVSAACGVSVATVSRALNRQGDVTPETAERIRRVAQEMGYFPNAAARALKTNRSYNIGILYENRMDHEFFSGMIDELRQDCARRGYDVTFLSGSIGGKEMTYSEHARYRGLDGIIIVQADFRAPQVQELAAGSIPCVLIDYEFSTCDCVLSDNKAGMELLTDYAFSRGYRRIACIHGENGLVSQQRVAGYRASCEKHRIPAAQEYIVEGHYHEPEYTADMVEKLLSLSERPDCILCPDDYSAVGISELLERKGFSVPADVALAGYDGISISRILRPRLTTFRQNTQEMGQKAVEILSDAIENPSVHQRYRVLIPGTVQPGETL